MDTERFLKWSEIIIDKNYLHGVSEENSFLHPSNRMSNEASNFYRNFWKYLENKLKSKMSKTQLDNLVLFKVGKLSLKTIAKYTDSSHQNAWKRIQDISSLIQRNIFYDKHVRNYIEKNSPPLVKIRFKKWFNTYKDDYYQKHCPVCHRILISSDTYLAHFKKFETRIAKTKKAYLSKKLHIEFIKNQKEYCKNILYKSFTTSAIEKILKDIHFKMNRKWIEEEFGKPIQKELLVP
jgi:hypothetical protein